MSKTWSSDETKELIQQYESYEILWNTKINDYRDRIKKSIIFKDLGEKFACSANEVQQKIHNLRNQVSQELKKIKKTKSGNGTDEIYVSKWRYFNALKFLIPFLSGSSTQSNLEISLDKSTAKISKISKSENTNASDKPKEDEIKTNKNEDIKKKLNRLLKRKNEEYEESLETALKILKKEPDEHDIFGKNVAQELRSLRSDVLKRKLKSEIRKAIARIADVDDSFSYSSSNTIPSPCPMNESSASTSSDEVPIISPVNPQTEDFQSIEDLQSTQYYFKDLRYEKF